MRRWNACVSFLLLQLVAALGVTGCGGSGGGTADFEQRPAAGLRKTPFEPSLSMRFTRVELGYGHTCGLTSDGRAFCMMTLTRAAAATISRQASIPLMPISRTSITTTSGRCIKVLRTASWPFAASSTTSNPGWRARSVRNPIRTTS